MTTDAAIHELITNHSARNSMLMVAQNMEHFNPFIHDVCRKTNKSGKPGESVSYYPKYMSP